MDKIIPDVYQKSIYTINYEKLRDNGIRCLLFDLDNTCAPINVNEPTKKLISLFDELGDMGFKIIIFSNSTKKRLEPFKQVLNVDCCAGAKKPRKTKLLKILKLFNFDLSEVALIGDQLYTDVYGGNRLNMHTILVEPIEIKDIWITKIKRPLENLVLTKYKDYDYQNDSKRLNWKKKSAKNKKIA